jgi:integrator complex subunit 9
MRRRRGRVFIEPELAENIIPSEIRPGLSLASVSGELEVKDNVYTIKVILHFI